MTPDLVVDLPFIACLRLLRPGFGDGLGSDRSICQRPRVSGNRASCIESERLNTIQAGETSSLFHELQVVCTANCRLIYVTSWRRLVASSFSGIEKKGWHFHQSADSWSTHAGFTTFVVDPAPPEASTASCRNRWAVQKRHSYINWAIELSSTARSTKWGFCILTS